MKERYAIIGREEELSERLKALIEATFDGLSVLSIPLIQAKGVDFQLPKTYEAEPIFLFTSPRAVSFFFDRAKLPAEAFAVSIGHATTRALCQYGVEPHFTSSIESAHGMAPELLHFLKSRTAGCELVQPCSDIAGNYIEEYFGGIGIPFRKLVTYQVTPHPKLSESIHQLNSAPEWILFYSPSGVRAWSEATEMRVPAFSIGPSTTKELQKQGWTEIHQSVSPQKEAIIKTLTKNYFI